jgi:hypothetical protein
MFAMITKNVCVYRNLLIDNVQQELGVPRAFAAHGTEYFASLRHGWLVAHPNAGPRTWVSEFAWDLE